MDEGLVERNGLSFYESVDRSGETVLVTIRGRLVCVNHVVIRIDKKLETRRSRANRLEVRTRFYQYHAWVRSHPGQPRRDLIRYDNSGEHSGGCTGTSSMPRGDRTNRNTSPSNRCQPSIEFIRHAIPSRELSLKGCGGGSSMNPALLKEAQHGNDSQRPASGGPGGGEGEGRVPKRRKKRSGAWWRRSKCRSASRATTWARRTWRSSTGDARRLNGRHRR